METLMKADIFFFVTTICVVAVAVAIIYLIIRLSSFMQTLENLAEELKDKAGDIGEEAEEMLERIKDSFVFRLIFGAKKTKSRKKK